MTSINFISHWFDTTSRTRDQCTTDSTTASSHSSVRTTKPPLGGLATSGAWPVVSYRSLLGGLTVYLPGLVTVRLALWSLALSCAWSGFKISPFPMRDLTAATDHKMVPVTYQVTFPVKEHRLISTILVKKCKWKPP